MTVPTSRLSSLDAFRGFTIASMVLVNNPGDWNAIYAPLKHAEWHGWTFTDWIFPFFLFIVGVSMTFSLALRAQAGAAAPRLLIQLYKRALIIILIGLALNFIPSFDLGSWRFPGVLQRIGLCTMLAAPLVVYTTWRGIVYWIIGLLTFYSVVMLNAPVPDAQGVVAAGALEPGKDVGAYIDRLLLSGHLWAKSKTWDPEGLFSTIPAVCSVLFGVLTGYTLRAAIAPAHKAVAMLLASGVLLGLGEVLDALLMPINKSLWTTSYCIFMTGWALLVFGGFYSLMDLQRWPMLRAAAHALFKPFTIFGLNALFVFVLSSLIAKVLNTVKVASASGAAVALKSALFAPIQALSFTPANASLVFALAFLLLMFAIAWGLWKKRWFIKI